jgi:hypothetical protein
MHRIRGSSACMGTSFFVTLDNDNTQLSICASGMKTKLLYLIICLISSLGILRAQTYPLPKDFRFDIHVGAEAYTKFVIPSINWLQQMPLNQRKEERGKLNDFVLTWLQTNPDINIGLPDYSYTFHGINDQLLYLFMESWIKYTLETKDTNLNRCRLAGIHGMLDYYNSGKAIGLGKNEFLDDLAAIEKQGALPELFDTAGKAKNTWIYLKIPPRTEYKYNENYLNFTFFCINLLHPRKIVYRYLLDGYYDNWIETKDGSAIFPRLPPGEYNFKVQASMYPDFRKVSEANYLFTIHKPVWLETWFLVATFATCASIVYFIIRQREKNLQHISQLKHERIVFEYEHLKSQVSPHFLFNSLNTLTNLISKDPAKAIGYTEHLSSLYHSILSHHENDLVMLSEELAILENYFSIQAGRFGEALKLEVDIPEEVKQTGKIVPLALQMLAENGIKHNIISIDRPLTISISANEQEITVRNTVQPKITKEKGGIGLTNIRRRYELLTNKPVTYGIYKNEFIVKMPLL